MKEIFQEYGGVLITVVAILAVILVVVAVVGKDAGGPIGWRFRTLSIILLIRQVPMVASR